MQMLINKKKFFEDFEKNYNSKKIFYLSHDGQKFNKKVLHIEWHKKKLRNI